MAVRFNYFGKLRPRCGLKTYRCCRRLYSGMFRGDVLLPCNIPIRSHQASYETSNRWMKSESDVVGESLASCFAIAYGNCSDVDMAPQQIVSTFASINDVVDVHMLAYPWALRDDRLRLNVQLLLNTEPRRIIDPITTSTEFAKLRTAMKRQCTRLVDADLIYSVVSLLRLGVDISDESFVAALQECRNRANGFDLESLSAYSEIGNLLGRNGFVIRADTVRTLQERWPHIPITAHNFNLISQMLYNLGYFVTSNNLQEFQVKVTDFMKHLGDEIEPTAILHVLEPLQRFSTGWNVEFVSTVAKYLDRHVDQMNPYQLFRTLHFTGRISGQYRFMSQLRSRVSARALRLIEDCDGGGDHDRMSSVDISLLSRTLDACSYPCDSQPIVTRLVADHMKDMDVILLKGMASTNIVRKDDHISELFCKRVDDKLRDIIKSTGCLLCIVRCLCQMKRIWHPVDQKLATYLCHVMVNGQAGLEATIVSTYGRYLIRYIHSSTGRTRDLTTDRYGIAFTERIVTLLPHMTVTEVMNVAQGFGKIGFHNRDRPSYVLYVDYVLTRVARELLSRRHGIKRLAGLNRIARYAFIKVSDVVRAGLVDDIAELYDRHTAAMDSSDFAHVADACHLLVMLRLRLEGAMDRLTDVLLSKHRSSRESVSMLDVSRVINMLAKFGHRPSSLPQVTCVAVDLANAELSGDCGVVDVINILRTAESLAALDVFSDKLVERIFNLKFLSRIEDVSDHSLPQPLPPDVRYTDYTLMSYQHRLLANFNRAVVLQCPHMSVPWFCDSYINRNNKERDSRQFNHWTETTQTGIREAFGGSQFVQLGPESAPYGLNFEFECILDQNGNVVPTNEVGEQHLRVAVLVATPKNYSINGRHPMSTLTNKITHLEILGYKVVTIPFYELDSMQLSHREAMNRYFREKIVGRGRHY